MTEAVETLKTWVQESKAIAFSAARGSSTESGIPDFRSTGGLYHQEWKYPPETILSHTFYKSNPEEFFRFYRAKMLAPEARPNAAHKKLAEWEAAGEAHRRGYPEHRRAPPGGGKQACLRAPRQRPPELLRTLREVLRPGLHSERDRGAPLYLRRHRQARVVLYEEGLDQSVMNDAVDSIARADLLIIGGTSLNVWPAAGLINYFRGKRLALINKSAVARDLDAGVVITDPIGEVLAQM